MRKATVCAAIALAALAATACRDEGDTRSPFTVTSSATGAAGADGSSGPGGAGGGPTGPAEPLRVVNWNVQNFFNDKDDSTAREEIVVSAAQYRQKRAEIAAVLKELDPDVAVLQEVEHLAALEDLNRIDLAGAYPHAALIDANDPRGIDVGALSKVPFDKVVSHKDDRFTRLGTQGPVYSFTRDCLELHLTRGGRKVVLLGVHYRSKSPPDDPDRRLAEAQRTRAIADAIAAEDPSAAILVLGDFNDLPGSPPVQAVAGSGENAFQSVVEVLPQGDQWTYDFNGQLQLIDHQMANPALRRMLDAGSVRIARGPSVEDASDHAPVLARYEIGAGR